MTSQDQPTGVTGEVEPLAKLAEAKSHKIIDALVALSMANLCFICAWFSMLHDADYGYFNKVPVGPASLLALLANLAWLGGGLWLLLQVRAHMRRPWCDLACGIVFGLLFLVPLEFTRVFLLHWPLYRFIAFVKSPLGISGCLAVGVITIWRPRLVAKLPILLAGILSPLAVLNLLRITFLLLGITHLKQHTSDPGLAALKPVQPGRPRVVWMIFDEMDERLAFEKRPVGLRLPEFDRLRAEALFATNAYPPADATLLSMPSLIAGKRVASATPISPSDLRLVLADTNAVVNWSELPTVFDAARELGFNTALVGWYHPYCRVLARGLNCCQWFAIPNFEPARAPGFGAAVQKQIGTMRGGLHLRSLFVELCPAYLSDALTVITNSTFGLTLLHLPLPHQPGIYKPETDALTAVGMPRVTGYFNNLVLADHWLGKLRHALESAGQWSNTWIIVSSDHSWRESRLYDGCRDLRVPFMLRSPGQNAPVVCATPLNTVITHDLILAILSGQLVPQNAGDWLQLHQARLQPTPTGPPVDGL